MFYSDQLLTKEWLAKRDSIKQRDDNKCVKCGSSIRLHVHHTYYQQGNMAWQYPDDSLITVCEICHKLIHDTIKIPVKKKPRKKPLTKVERLAKYKREMDIMIDNALTATAQCHIDNKTNYKYLAPKIIERIELLLNKS